MVGAAFLVGRGVLAPQLDLTPVTGANLWFANLTAALVILFGVVDALIARDPARWRPVIPVMAAGKVLAFVFAAVPSAKARSAPGCRC